MPATPCTGARRRKLPTGHPSRLRAGARVLSRLLCGTGGTWLLPAQSPILHSRPFDMARTALTMVQGGRDVSEYGRSGRRGQLGEAGRPPQAVERTAEGRGSVAAAARGGHRRGEPGDSGCAAGAGAVAAGVPGRWPARAEEEEPTGRRADADPGKAGRDDDAGRVAGGASRRTGC